jgi:ribosomal protein S18 acetylase RimI-like enzyme
LPAGHIGPVVGGAAARTATSLIPTIIDFPAPTRQGNHVNTQELTQDHLPALDRFFDELPAGDLTFIKENVTDTATRRSWPQDRRTRRWVSLTNDGAVTGFVAVLALTGWSDHVGELRLAVHPEHRRGELGRALARFGLTEAISSGLSKVVVELIADQEHALGMFSGLGFTGEALLRDHIRDRDGTLHDLVMLAHHVDSTWSAMNTVCLADELTTGG